MRPNILLVAMGIALSLTGCLVPADSTVQVRGAVVDGEGKRFEHCTFKLFHSSKLNDTISWRTVQDDEFGVSGEFVTSFVIGPGKDSYAVGIECRGAASPFVTRPYEAGTKETRSVDIGRVVMRRAGSG